VVARHPGPHCGHHGLGRRVVDDRVAQLHQHREPVASRRVAAQPEGRDAARPDELVAASDAVLDVLRVQVAASHDDGVLEAPHHEDLALVHEAQIARAQVARGVAVEGRLEGVARLLGEAVIARGAARRAHPDLAHVLRRALGGRLRVDDAHHHVGRGPAAANALHRLSVAAGELDAPVSLEGGAVEASAGPASHRDAHGVLGEPVRGAEGTRVEPARGEGREEGAHRLRADGLGRAHHHSQGGEVPRLALRLGGLSHHEVEAEVGRHGVRGAHARGGLEPEVGPLHEAERRHHPERAVAVQRREDAAHQTEVVVVRHPHQHAGLGAKVELSRVGAELVLEVAEGDEHAARRRGRARCVLHEGDVVGRRRRARGRGVVAQPGGVDPRELWERRAGVLGEVAGEARVGGVGEVGPRSRAAGDGAQQRKVLGQVVWIGGRDRHGHDPGEEASQEGPDEVEGGRVDEHHAVAGREPGGGESARDGLRGGEGFATRHLLGVSASVIEEGIEKLGCALAPAPP